jgi:hypothetical protein
MPTKTKNPWDFNPKALTAPYVLLIPGVFIFSMVVGIIAGDFIKWGGLTVYTAFIFGYFVNDSRQYLKLRQFWILTACLLTSHLAVFIVVLLHVAVWKLLWFMVMILELPVFSRLRDRLPFK